MKSIVANRFYTCMGVLRQNCGTHHKKLEAAETCLDKDQKLCKRYNGFSDRYIVYWDGGKFENVTLPKSRFVPLEESAERV